jgi:uncharacterized repeat protein (TIGR01451 family)
MRQRLVLLADPRARALHVAFAAMLVSLSVLCVQLLLLQAGLVRAQGTLDVCAACTYETIQEAIDAADPGDTIRVAQGVYTENLVITKSLTVLGGYESAGWTRDPDLYETTIDGNRSGSVISVTNGCSTTIDGFTITNGATDCGGGISVHGSSVTVTNNTIEDNITWFTGKAITITEPLLAGATVVSGTCDPNLIDIVLVRDVTTDSRIGWGEAEADGTFSASLDGPLVEGHLIEVFGAYGYDEATVQPGLGASVDVHSVAEALGEGPGSRLLDDLAESQGVGEGLSEDLGQGIELPLRGGGIYLLESTAVITGNRVVSNTARDFGGGIYAEKSVVTMAGNDVVSNTNGREVPYWYSWDWGYGGGIAILPGCEFTVTGNLLAENTVMVGGGGVYVTDSMGSIVGNEIVANRNYSESDWAYGGGLYVANCSPLIQGNDILSNTLNTLGTEEFPGDDCACGGGVYLVGSSSLVTDNDIVGNAVVVGWTRTSGQGGGIHIQQAPNDGYPYVCAGYSEEQGPEESWPVVANNRLIGNSAHRGLVEPLSHGAAGVGGAVSVRSSSVSLLENEIIGNSAGFWAGGVSILSWSPDGDFTAVVSGNQVIDNRGPAAERVGGYGGLLVGATTATIESNVIAGNEGFFGGGLYVVGAPATVRNNDIVGNKSVDVGGLLAGDDSTEIFISGNRVVGNEGAVGGIGLEEGSIVLSHNEIMSNSGAMAGGVGASAEDYSTTTVTLDANRIVANHSTALGGGMRIWPDVAFTLTNNVIADNSAEELGGGICISDSQGTLINNTIAENEEGAGEGIYLDGTAEVTILNNVIVSHTYGIYNAGSGTLDVTYNDLWGNSVGDYYGLAPGTGNISSNPWFVDPDNWDYHLWVTSPAVDAGHPDEDLAPSLDIDGEPRPLGSRVDMGADEVPFEVWIWKSDLPDPVLPGGLVTYTIRLSNVSEESIGGLVMTDRVPLNTALHWASDEYEETEGVVSWSVGTLGFGEQVTRTMVVQVDGGLTDGTVIDNGQYGANSEELTRPVMGVPVQTRVGVPLLEISKLAEPDPVRAGDTLTYTLEVTNNGGIRATGVVLSDRVPVNTQFSGASDGGLESGGVVTWSIGELASGQSLARILVVTVAEGLADGTEIENAEYGVGCEEVPEAVMGPGAKTTVGVPALSIGKSDQPDPVLPGEELTYTIVVTNDGGWEATALVITDRIPANTTFHEASDGGVLLGDVVSWTVPSLEVGVCLERTLVVTVSEELSDNTTIENDEYGVRGEGIEPVMGTPEATLVGRPILTIGKEAEPEWALPGEELEYTITVTNEGHHVATGVVITDRVPLHAEFAWVLDGGELVGDEVRWTGLSVEPGDSVTMHWGVTVTEDLLADEVVNESYGVVCSEVTDTVLGEALHTPILRYELLFPLGMKERLWGLP